ncbi:MAG: LLM class F420-dependent oxidoreductase [Acidimicrobiales bacterium]|nr:LLM class F420-dependent oxidoreductase [Acidimicrobiales bacterium]
MTTGSLELGLQLGYWGRGPDPHALDTVLKAEDMGFDSIWTAEAWGSDALTPLAWYGSHTTSIKLGQSIIQLSARTPTATAMALNTLQHLSDGRVICGLGVSGPQVVEGWYGQPFEKPLARTREYVDIMKQVWARDEPVSNDGPHYPLPYPADGPGATGKGKPLKSITHPHPTPIPVYLAAEGPKNLALAGEMADGWLPIWMSPDESAWYEAQIQAGMDRAPGKSWNDFGVAAVVPTFVHDDVEAAIDVLRPNYALYIGGMGARDENYHYEVFARMSEGRYEGDCARIQDLYLEGKKDEAAAAVPASLIDDVALVGPAARIRDRAQRWEESIVDTLLLGGPWEIVEAAGRVLLP